MTGRELQDYIEWLGVPRGELAEYLGVDYRTMTRWLNGETPVPRMLEIIIKAGAIQVEDIQETVTITKKKIV
jgi:transcriptional regulator with XRE-family HTH domain